MRYQQLINRALEDGASIRDLANAFQISATAVHNYANTNVEPRLKALKNIGDYFNEPLSVLLSEDDNLTAELIILVRSLPPKDKERLLEALKNR